MAKRLVVSAAALLAVALISAAPAAGTTTERATADENVARSHVDPAVADLMADEDISLSAAKKRIGWQRELRKFVPALKRTVDKGILGGIWVDNDDGGRLKVGLVSDGPSRQVSQAWAETVADIADRFELGQAVDAVPVVHSEAELVSAAEWLGEQLVRVNEDAAWPLGSGYSPADNAVNLYRPREERLTIAGRDLIDQARARYGSMLRVRVDERRYAPEACTAEYCDPPLRGAVRIWHPDGVGCSLAFLARSQADSKLYAMTAGHCVDPNRSEWGTYIPSEPRPWALHRIGPVLPQLWTFSENGDMAAIQVVNEAGWNARAWVLVHARAGETTADPEYPILADDFSHLGQRICRSGATSGTDCGEVLELGVTVDYGEVTVNNMARTNYCSDSGDSGGSVFAFNVAYGIHSGGPTQGCGGIYQGIRAAEETLRMSISHDAG